MLTREIIATKTARRTKERPFTYFADTITIQELSRAEWRETLESAKTDPDKEGNTLTKIDPWNAATLAYGALGGDGKPLFTRTEILTWPNRDDLWAEISDIANDIRDFSGMEEGALEKK